MFTLHQTHNQEQNSTNTAQTINSSNYQAENSWKCERKQELVKSRGVFKLFAATVAKAFANYQTKIYRHILQ